MQIRNLILLLSMENQKKDIGDISTLPFQLQIHFTRLDGAKCIRVISKTQEVTDVREVAEENMNIGVIGLHSVQQTAKIAEDGDYTKARLKTITHQKLVKRAFKNKKNKTSEEEKQYQNWMTEAEKMDKVIKKAQRQNNEGYNSDEDDDVEVKSMTTDVDKMKEKYDHKSNRQKQRKQFRTKDDQFSNVMYQNQNPFTSKFL